VKTVLSLFSGCGGMDLGFEGDFDVLAASVNTKIHSDWLIPRYYKDWVRLRPTMFKTVFANDVLQRAQSAWIPFFQRRGTQPDVFHLGSIIDLVKAKENGNEKIFPDKIDVVTGGFPCQDFSVAGKRRGFQSHKDHNGALITDFNEPTIENRGMLYFWMKRVIEITRPKMFIAENVKGLTNLADTKAVIENDFKNMGDSGYLVVSARIINAADYGVPQTRERVIFFGFLKSVLKPEALVALNLNKIPGDFDPYPIITHLKVAPNIEWGTKVPWVTAGAVLHDLKEPDGAIDDLSQANYSKARYYGNHCQGQTEVQLDRPAQTIRAEHHGNIEFRRLSKEHGGRITKELDKGLIERRLTVRECARLQTFPDNYEFIRRKTNQNEFILSESDGYRLIGNAVPPLLAYSIASRIQEIWYRLFKEQE